MSVVQVYEIEVKNVGIIIDCIRFFLSLWLNCGIHNFLDGI